MITIQQVLPRDYIVFYLLPRVYNKEGVSYSSIVPVTAVVRVQARLMIFTKRGTSQVTP